MTDTQLTRRDFLVDSSRLATAGWLALRFSWLGAAAACARDDARNEAAFVTLTPAEAKAMRAFAAQIIPSGDGLPGAEEAGAVYFVDRSLRMPFFADSAAVVRAGLADLDGRAWQVDRKDFGSLEAGQQVQLMRGIEREPFFATARMLVIVGTFADPSYGGNRNHAGWTLVGMEHKPSYSAPFGWYDAQQGGVAARYGA